MEALGSDAVNAMLIPVTVCSELILEQEAKRLPWTSRCGSSYDAFKTVISPGQLGEALLVFRMQMAAS
ncbi:uncharacterized protein IUM83_11833 [Phytophthora cinnamomi]|uniref:uncharacterized protein n=1 Tax=Phytophthora cinnamomi TaxID=4785 RepID=UPI003559B7C5|nr:hypothetical protein IUM83_11833 [Phytophthora cinnamomi]